MLWGKPLKFDLKTKRKLKTNNKSLGHFIVSFKTVFVVSNSIKQFQRNWKVERSRTSKYLKIKIQILTGTKTAKQ